MFCQIKHKQPTAATDAFSGEMHSFAVSPEFRIYVCRFFLPHIGGIRTHIKVQ
jgi:hypothetical protein